MQHSLGPLAYGIYFGGRETLCRRDVFFARTRVQTRIVTTSSCGVVDGSSSS